LHLSGPGGEGKRSTRWSCVNRATLGPQILLMITRAWNMQQQIGKHLKFAQNMNFVCVVCGILGWIWGLLDWSLGLKSEFLDCKFDFRICVIEIWSWVAFEVRIELESGFLDWNLRFCWYDLKYGVGWLLKWNFWEKNLKTLKWNFENSGIGISS
jgi:hypothetical protein